MVSKELKLEGYGKVFIQPISVVEKEFETVSPEGKPVKTKMVGTRAKTVYVTEDGVEIPSGQVCKKLVIEGEELISPKFGLTKEVGADMITVQEENGIVYRALERKFYSATTDDERIKKAVLTENKTLVFPFVGGAGWKVWSAALTNWNGKLLLVGCRGDLAKELSKYDEETVEFTIEAIPQASKRLLKAIAMV